MANRIREFNIFFYFFLVETEFFGYYMVHRREWMVRVYVFLEQKFIGV